MPELVGSTTFVIEPSRMGARVLDGAKFGPSGQGYSPEQRWGESIPDHVGSAMARRSLIDGGRNDGICYRKLTGVMNTPRAMVGYQQGE
jgi:hypothetical protein